MTLELKHLAAYLPYGWHFDLFGLIENGLAVDINTLQA